MGDVPLVERPQTYCELPHDVDDGVHGEWCVFAVMCGQVAEGCLLHDGVQTGSHPVLLSWESHWQNSHTKQTNHWLQQLVLTLPVQGCEQIL